MSGYEVRGIIKCVLVAILIGGLLVSAGIADVRAAPAYRGTEEGKGEGIPPDHARVVGNNDPDDDGRGPDRGDGMVDKEDWNNGCGNDADRDDDNEGICGPYKPPSEQPPTEQKPIVEKRPTVTMPLCKVVLLGRTPELFPGWVSVRNPANEKFVLAESHGYLEYVVERGTELQVLWWDEVLGHGDSQTIRFVCNASEITLIEPVFWYGLD